MDLAITIVGVLVGVLGGIFGGYRLGERVRGNPKKFWSWNAAVFVGCVLLSFAGRVFGEYWLAVSAIGLMGGAITGLKYGYSESIGVWRMFDSWTGGDAELRPPAELQVGPYTITHDPADGPETDADAPVTDRPA